MTRYLLRGCLRELVREHVIQPRGERRKMSILEIHPWSHRIGIVICDGSRSPCIDKPGILSGVLRFFLENQDILPQILSFSSTEELFQQMKQYELDGCLWIVSHEEPALDAWKKAAAEKYRFVFASESFKSDFKSNAVCLDPIVPKREIIRAMMAAGAKKIAYMSSIDRYFKTIRAELEHAGLPWRDSFWISGSCENGEELRRLVLDEGVDGLICEGAFGLYHSALKAIAALPDSKRPVLAVTDNWRFRKELSGYPELDKMTFVCCESKTSFEKLGHIAGKMLLRALETGKTQKNEFGVLPQIGKYRFSDLVCAENIN